MRTWRGRLVNGYTLINSTAILEKSFFFFTAVIEMRRARFVLICFCHTVFLGISSLGMIYILEKSFDGKLKKNI